MTYNSKVYQILEANTPKYYPENLSYGLKDLSPVINKQTMNFHYNEHYKGYIKKLNELLVNKPKPPIVELIKNIKKYDTGVRDNAGGYYNHSLFWKFITPKGSKFDSNSELGKAIKDEFDSFNGFKNKFIETGKSQFGSGWVWLVKKNNKLEVLSTPNQDNPLMGNNGRPILGCDVWEHAYYLMNGPDRSQWLSNFFSVIHWNHCNTLYISD